MKTVVSDTSPIRYLIFIGEQELLPQLFGKIQIPYAVFQELTDKNTPDVVRKFMLSFPKWINIHEIKQKPDILLNKLDKGEKEAILLTEKIHADILLIDEKKGRLAAKARGLKTTGVLGVLELASIELRLNLPQLIEKLLQTNIKVSPSLIQHILDRYYQRGGKNIIRK